MRPVQGVRESSRIGSHRFGKGLVAKQHVPIGAVHAPPMPPPISTCMRLLKSPRVTCAQSLRAEA